MRCACDLWWCDASKPAIRQGCVAVVLLCFLNATADPDDYCVRLNWPVFGRAEEKEEEGKISNWKRLGTRGQPSANCAEHVSEVGLTIGQLVGHLFAVSGENLACTSVRALWWWQERGAILLPLCDYIVWRSARAMLAKRDKLHFILHRNEQILSECWVWDCSRVVALVCMTRFNQIRAGMRTVII